MLIGTKVQEAVDGINSWQKRYLHAKTFSELDPDNWREKLRMDFAEKAVINFIEAFYHEYGEIFILVLGKDDLYVVTINPDYL